MHIWLKMKFVRQRDGSKVEKKLVRMMHVLKTDGGVIIVPEYDPRGSGGAHYCRLSVCLVSSILLSNVSYVRTHYVSFIQS